jgi:hypothetical protein
MHSKAQERNFLFKTIWALSDQNPILSLDVEIPVTEYKSVSNIEIKRNGQDDFSVTVQVTQGENFRTFTKTELSFLEAFSIVNRICVYNDHRLLYLFDQLSEDEPEHIFCNNGPLSIHGFDTIPSNKGDWVEVL